MEELCMVRAKPNWNFVRKYTCSLPAGHTSAHRAHWEHDLTEEVAWVGPWEDGSYYIVPAESGLIEWNVSGKPNIMGTSRISS